MNSQLDIKKHLIARTLDKVTTFLIEDRHLSLEEALDIVYNSRTLALLEDASNELYVQSPAYVYEMVQEELAD